MNESRALQRIEAFSDGVFAIAATLLILEIKVPQVANIDEPMALWPALQQVWPSLIAFGISFGTILVMWVSHHRSMHMLVRSSKPFLFANGFLLLTVTFIPFPTAVLAQYIDTPQANVAVMAYSASFAFSNFGFNIWWLTMRRPINLLSPSITPDVQNKISFQTISGFVVYCLTTILAYWFPVLSLIINFALFILWVGMSLGDKNEN